MLTEKKRKWIVQQFRAGRSATSIARIQRISRQQVYRLAKLFKKEGSTAYIAKRPGRPSQTISHLFANKVVAIRKHMDYGSVKLHIVLVREGFAVSQRQIQKILDQQKLTDPCLKRRGQRTYVHYEWPIIDYMWHCDWSQYKRRWYCAFIDDKSRKIMALMVFNNANENHAIYVLHIAILANESSPIIVLSDKGPQFYNNSRDKKGKRTLSLFEQECVELGIDSWTARRRHPQTNGKMEKWFDTMKQRFRKHPDEKLEDFVQWYNTERIHQSLGYKTPEEVHRNGL